MTFNSMTADDIIRTLKLAPLPLEGGFYRETYRAPLQVMAPRGSDGPIVRRSASTAIYYLVTPDSFSTLHRVPFEEVFHFYLGDPVEMFVIQPDGSHTIDVLGSDIMRGQHPQKVVNGGLWQGTRLLDGGKWALLGTTVSPGFDFADFESGPREEMCEKFPVHGALIERFTR